jgi:hypothetical protein
MIDLARVRARTGQAAQAIRDLLSVQAQASSLGYRLLEFEARVAFAGMNSSGNARATLEALEREARKEGFGLIARKAYAQRWVLDSR